MKIIITGATGFLGGWLVKHFLEKNIDIIVINNSSRNIKNRVSQYIIKKYSDECNEKFINLMDSDSINNLVKAEKPDAIFHLAAIGDVTVAFDDPKNTFQISSNATLNLLEAIRNESPNTLFVSHTTDKVYSGNPVPFHEGMNLNPEHIYEVAKISQEFLTKIYAKSYNIKTVTLRCGNYFGGFDFNFNRII